MKNIIVLDNFYETPELVRDYALTKATYLSKKQLAPQFPGTESVHSFTSTQVIKKIEKAVGASIVVNPAKYSFGVFAKTSETDQSKKMVHVDSSEWTGIVYLNLPNECHGGTCFYQHVTTGLNAIPTTIQLRQMGYENSDDFIQNFLRPRSQKSDEWKLSVKVGMKFNRLVLFKAGALFHAAENYFGSSEMNCRLTQLFFFSTQEAS